MPDDEHDQPPESGQIDLVGTALDRAHDAARDGIGLGPQRAFGESGGHRGIDETGLDRQHLHALPGQPIAQSLHEETDHALGRAIHVIASPAAIAGD